MAELKKHYWKVSERQAELNELRENGITRGYSVGWDVDDLNISIKLGATTYVAGVPSDGKTEFWLEILLNLSVQYGLKHAIYSPETGSVEEVIAELCTKHLGKPYIKCQGSMSESEKTYAEMFIEEHFYIIDPIDDDITIKQFYNLVDQIEREEGTTIHTTCIDPFNEISHDFSQDSGRQDLYIERVLGDVRKNARAKNRHNCVITHVRDQQQITQDGVTYSPMPTARDIAGGQAWFRKGLLVLIVWRPPYGLQDSNGMPYEKNETHVKVAKSKPKGISKNGVYKMFYDLNRSAYYVRDRVYSKRHKKPEPKQKELELKPSTDFEEKDINHTIESKGKVYEFPDINEEETFKN